MVTACKNYITNDGMFRIWDQPYEKLLSKLHAATRLYKEYQKCFHKTKKKIDEIPGARSFDFSEMYIFGKFDAFCKRIDKVRNYFMFYYWFHCTSHGHYTVKLKSTLKTQVRFKLLGGNVCRPNYPCHINSSFINTLDSFSILIC